jgi:hypothetical protein
MRILAIRRGHQALGCSLFSYSTFLVNDLEKAVLGNLMS